MLLPCLSEILARLLKMVGCLFCRSFLYKVSVLCYLLNQITFPQCMVTLNSQLTEMVCNEYMTCTDFKFLSNSFKNTIFLFLFFWIFINWSWIPRYYILMYFFSANKTIFGGIFPTSLYYPPAEFCWDYNCDDDSIDDDPNSSSYNLEEKV